MTAATTDWVPTPEPRLPSRRAAWGCLTAIAVVVVLVAGGLIWLNHHFNPPPVRIATSPESMRPWPAPLEVVAERKIVGSPSVSIETAPPIERLYVLLRSDGLDAHEVAARAAAHLTSLGWQMEPEDRPVWWFDFASRTSRTGESAYVGPLTTYLDSDLWAVDDEGAPEELRRLAGASADRVVVVELFAREE